MAVMKDKQRFAALLLKQRKARNYTLEQLSDGLCSISMLAKVEAGKRLPDKILRDRLLERLGMSGDGYEVFLGCEDYIRYEKRLEILQCMEQKQFLIVEELAERYGRIYGEKQPLEKQFCLTVLAEVKKQQGEERNIQLQYLKKAIDISMPAIEILGLNKKVLALKELNLLLEYAYCKEEQQEWYQTYMEYLEKLPWEKGSIAKIYPKAVWYYYISCKKYGWNTKQINMLSRYCNKAIELLRNTKKMYFLWELFEMKEELLSLGEYDINVSDEERKHQQKEINAWKVALRFVVKEAFYPKKMTEEMVEEHLKTASLCYMYREKGVCCIGDVIRKRRQMLGISRKELCEGICAEKTLGAIERKQHTPQEQIRIELFERLHLSAEYQRKDFITDDADLYELNRKLSGYINEWEWDKAEVLCEILENCLDMKDKINRQFVQREQAVIANGGEKISNEELVRCVRKALELSLNFELASKAEVIYLTSTEKMCLYSIMNAVSSEERLPYMRLFEKFFSEYEQDKTVFSVIEEYELIMPCISQEYGNLNNRKRSDEISRSVMRECLSNQRMHFFHMNLYDIFWNNMHDQFYEANYWLQCCITLARLFKDDYYERWYKRKMFEFSK